MDCAGTINVSKCDTHLSLLGGLEERARIVVAVGEGVTVGGVGRDAPK